MKIEISTTEEQDRALEINGTTLQVEVNRVLQRLVNNAKEEFKQQFVDGKTLIELESIKASMEAIIVSKKPI